MPGGHGNLWQQTAFRGRNDDGNETDATWIAPVNTNWSQRPDRNFRVRLQVGNPELGIASAWLTWTLGGFGGNQFVSTSSPNIIAVESPHYVDADNTTEQLPSTPLTYRTNEGMTNNSGISNTIFLDPDGETEVEWCLQIVGNDVEDGDVISLRSQIGAADYGGGYFEFPQITVDKPRTIRRLIII